MTRTLLALVLTATAATRALATPPPYNNGIVYTVAASRGTFVADCTVVADRWTADYGPTYVTAVAAEPAAAVAVSVRCRVTKNGTTYVDTGLKGAIVNERHGTIPVEGIQVCVDAVATYTDASTAHIGACVDG